MTIEQLKAEIENCEIELRKLFDDVKDTSKPFNEEEVRAKKAEIEKRKADFERQLAELSRPPEGDETRSKTFWREIAEKMQKRTPVALNGTGTVLTLKELVKAATNKFDILDRAKYFYGPNGSTIIPIWASHATAAFVDEGGSATAQSKSIGKTTLTPAQAMSSLPVTQMTLDLSAVDLENELPEIFGEAFGALMATGMLTGDGSTNKMTGLFTASGVTAYTKAITVANLAGMALTLMTKKYANPAIIMSPTVYNAFLADTSTDETTKLYKEDLIRNKSIEGVKVILTGFAPTAVSATSIIATGCDLNNYAIGVGGELKIVPKETASSSVVTFDAYAYFNGAPVIPGDVIAYTVAS